MSDLDDFRRAMRGKGGTLANRVCEDFPVKEFVEKVTPTATTTVGTAITAVSGTTVSSGLASIGTTVASGAASLAGTGIASSPAAATVLTAVTLTNPVVLGTATLAAAALGVVGLIKIIEEY